MGAPICEKSPGGKHTCACERCRRFQHGLPAYPFGSLATRPIAARWGRAHSFAPLPYDRFAFSRMNRTQPVRCEGIGEIPWHGSVRPPFDQTLGHDLQVVKCQGKSFLKKWSDGADDADEEGRFALATLAKRGRRLSGLLAGASAAKMSLPRLAAGGSSAGPPRKPQRLSFWR